MLSKSCFLILNIMLLLCFKTSAGADAYDPSVIQKWAVMPSSFMKIDGNSNISSFTCDVTQFLSTDTLTYISNDRNQKQGQFHGQLQIEIKRFDCHHRFITNDLRRTLKEDDFPIMKIRFLTLDKLNKDAFEHPINGIVEIELAGVLKHYNVAYQIQQSTNEMNLIGEKTVLFSDFNLKAPSRVGGLIKIDEEIKVHFQLHLKPLKSLNAI